MNDNFKEITSEIWIKVNRGIILSAAGAFSLAWFILKYLFSKEY